MKKSSQSTSTPKRTARSAAEAESVLAYYDLRCEALLSALSAAQEFYAVEGVHELRVEIKRLRALYKLAEHVAPSFAAKPNASALKRLFRAAGELRDIDIYQAIALKRIKKLDLREYFNHLKREELRCRESFTGVSRSFSRSALAGSRARLKSALFAVSSERMSTRMRKRISKLTTRLTTLVSQDNHMNEDLHSVRKVSKALRYTLDVWELCYGKTPTAEAASVQLKKTYTYLGEWHDDLLALGSVNKFLKHKSRKGIGDPTAYARFQDDLSCMTKRKLAAYTRGRKGLQRTLDRVLLSLQPEKGERSAQTG